MRIGMDIGMSKSPDAATIGGLGYEYTWAWDTSSLDAITQIGGRVAFNASLVSTGIQMNRNGNAATTIQIVDADIGSSASAATMPAGMVPTSAANAIGHGGRYMSVVCSYSKCDLPVGSTFINAWGMNTATTSSGVLQTFAVSGNTDRRIKYVNGEEVSASWGTQTDWNSIVGAGPTTLTYDLEGANFVSSTSDPTIFRTYPDYTNPAIGAIDWSCILHGVVFSSTVPYIKSLPIEISSPSI